MAELIWTDTALSSLDEIAEYIALDNPYAAKALVKEVLDQAERLIDFPESGRKLPELQELPYREVIINPCRIVYKFEPSQNQISILDVVRQERELLRYFAALEAEHELRSE